MSESREGLGATAIVGAEAQRFMDGELGRIVCGLAEHEVANAVDDFLTADPTDLPKVRDCQLRMAQGRKFKAWLIDLINDGEESLAVLKQQRDQG